MTQACVPHSFRVFVETYERVAADRGVVWNVPTNPDGVIPREHRWDLCALTGSPKPPSFSLTSLGMLGPVVDQLNIRRAAAGLAPVLLQALSPAWQQISKAFAIRALFERRNGAAHVYNSVCRPMRALATCCHDREPWALTAEDASNALELLGRVDRNAKLRSLAEAVLVVFDANSLSINGPLMGGRNRPERRFKTQTVEVRKQLDERRRADRLPGDDEFWEMLRILLEEKPSTRLDAVRFCATELCMLLGLRAEETATIPREPINLKEHFDLTGRRPSLLGGRDHTMFLRHFSEKQGLRSSRTVVYAETSTSVVDRFEQEVSSIVMRAQSLTAELRTRLRSQIETQRHFPEIELDAVVPLADIYPRLTGNPFVFSHPANDDLARDFRENLSAGVLDEIKRHQDVLAYDGAPFSQAVRVYFARPENAWMPKLDTRTMKPASKGTSLHFMGIRVSDLEAAVRSNLPTKLSDIAPFPLGEGRFLQTDDCLFLVPKRALSEGRNDGVCDVTRYAFVGRLTAADLSGAMGAESNQNSSFFAKYGRENARSYHLNPHSLRHMHNNELFLAGVADTIITNRFGRRSVAQSHAYDSRTLAQELAAMDLPEGSTDLLVGPAREVLKLISTGRASGPIVDQFKRIQQEEGDEAAVAFLAAEADGMQITPYGVCLNSFVVEPCPRHLECFNGCSHLVRTGMEGENAQLKRLADRYRTVLASIATHPGNEAAKRKAREQAERRLAAIEKVIKTPVGERAFPDGLDLSSPPQNELFGSLR